MNLCMYVLRRREMLYQSGEKSLSWQCDILRPSSMVLQFYGSPLELSPLSFLSRPRALLCPLS